MDIDDDLLGVDVEVHAGHMRNWRQERRALKLENQNLANEVRKLRQRRADLIGLSKDYQHKLRESIGREKDTRVRPIIAIFHSIGESLPQEGAVDAEVLAHRREMLRKWTGLKDLDVFVRNAAWQTDVVRPGPHPTFNHREELLIYLIWFRRGFSFTHLKLLLGLGKTRTVEIIRNVLAELVEWSRLHVFFPNYQTWLFRTTQDFLNVFPNVYIFVADGTPLPSLSSTMPSLNRKMWNHKHSMIAKCVTIVTTIDGGVVWVSHTVPGGIHDREAWNAENIALLLARFYANLPLPPTAGPLGITVAIGGDKGYAGAIIPRGWTIFLPQGMKKFPYRDPPNTNNQQNLLYCPRRQDAKMDARFATYRRVVEGAIAFLKDNKIFVNPEFVFWHDAMLNDCLQVGAGLYNFNKYL